LVHAITAGAMRTSRQERKKEIFEAGMGKR
jgi:hypothetical protein